MTSIQARILLLALLAATCTWAAACTREHRDTTVVPGPQLGESTASPALQPTGAPPDAAGPVEVTARISAGARGNAPVVPGNGQGSGTATPSDPAGTTLAPSDTPPVVVPVAPSVTPIPPRGNAPVTPGTPAPNAPATPTTPPAPAQPAPTPPAPTTPAPTTPGPGSR